MDYPKVILWISPWGQSIALALARRKRLLMSNRFFQSYANEVSTADHEERSLSTIDQARAL